MIWWAYFLFKYQTCIWCIWCCSSSSLSYCSKHRINSKRFENYCSNYSLFWYFWDLFFDVSVEIWHSRFSKDFPSERFKILRMQCMRWDSFLQKNCKPPNKILEQEQCEKVITSKPQYYKFEKYLQIISFSSFLPI